MFLEAILLSFAVAWFRGGRLKDDFGLKGMWMAPVAFALQLLNRVLPPGIHLLLTVISYGFLLYFSWLNIKNQGIRFILIGMVLNVLVIFVNQGRIPVDIETARSIGVGVEEFETQVMAKHAPLTSESYLPFLGDVIPVRYPFKRMISIGDVFALIGAFLLIQDLMGKPIRVLRSEEAK